MFWEGRRHPQRCQNKIDYSDEFEYDTKPRLKGYQNSISHPKKKKKGILRHSGRAHSWQSGDATVFQGRKEERKKIEKRKMKTLSY